MNATLVGLHGFLGRGEDWRPLVSDWPFDLLLPDLPGHGATPVSGDPDNALSRAVEQVRSLAEGAAALMGYSMGGRLALAAACAGVPGLRALVIVAAHPGLVQPAERAARLAQDMKRAEQLRGGGTAAFLQTWYDQPVFASLARHPALRDALVSRRAGAPAAPMAEALEGLSVGRQVPLWERLPDLQVPVLFVAGDEDRTYADLMRRVADLSARGACHIVPGAGHMPHLEQPDAFAAAVRPFLARYTGAA